VFFFIFVNDTHCGNSRQLPKNKNCQITKSAADTEHLPVIDFFLISDMNMHEHMHMHRINLCSRELFADWSERIANHSSFIVVTVFMPTCFLLSIYSTITISFV